MAYKQSPGRQAMPKTGRGLSPVLMSGCGSPMKQQVSKKPKNPTTGNEAPAYHPGDAGGNFAYAEGNRTTYNPNSSRFQPKPVGATYNATTGNYEPNKAKSFEIVKDKGQTNVVKRGGKVIMRNTSHNGTGKNNFDEDVKIARGSHVRDSLNTAHANERQAREYNARKSGSAPESKESKEAFSKWQAAKAKKVIDDQTKRKLIKTGSGDAKSQKLNKLGRS
jgi:hypothetical protein